MTTRKTPQQEKTLFYQKDHHVVTEHPKSFARSWPHKKARANRKYRRQIGQVLDMSVRRDEQEDEEAQPLQSRSIRRDTVRKWSPPVTMREWVKSRLDNRARRTAWRHYFMQPYDRIRHRESFVGFLRTITLGQGEYSYRLARYLNELLDPPEPLSDSGQDFGRSPSTQIWLRAFFSDEPEWEVRLRNWIRGLLL